MAITSVRDIENNGWKGKENKQTNKQTKRKRTRGDRSSSERVRAKLFCFAFKLGLLQLICKV